MSLGIALGNAVGGFAKGLDAGLDIQDRLNDRKYKQAQSENLKKLMAQQKSSGIMPGETGGMPDKMPDVNRAPRKVNLGDTSSLASVQEQPMQSAPMVADDTQTYDVLGGQNVAKFAQGGRVDASTIGLDYEGMANTGQTAQIPAQAPQTPQMTASQSVGLESASPMTQPQQDPQKIEQSYNKGKALKETFNSMMDTAAKYGKSDDALKYFQASFGIEERMIKEALPMAQRQFAMSGDPSGFIKLYNDTYDDNHQITGYKQDAEGNFVFSGKGMNGQGFENKLSRTDLEGLINTFQDPQARWTAKQQAAAARADATFKTDEEIRKEKAKGFELSAGQARYDGNGNKVASNDKPIQVDELDVMIKAANGDPEAIKTANFLVKQKERVAGAGRAPREPSFEDKSYNDWASEPANKGKGRNQYLKEKASWSNAGLDSVTTSTEAFDKETGALQKTSRTSKVKPEKPESGDYKAYKQRYELYKDNPDAQKKLNDIARAKGIIK